MNEEEAKEVGQDIAIVESSYVRTGKPGHPSKYTPATVRRLLAAIADGLTYKSACITAGIGVTTLADWRKEHPELELKMEEAREKARHKMLKRIKVAADDDWRAAAEYLKLVHAEDYRRVAQPNQTNQHLHVHGDTIVLTPEKQAELREQRRRIIATSRDAQRTLAGDHHAGDVEPAQSYRVKRQSLLADTQARPAQPEGVIEAIEQQPEQPEQPEQPQESLQVSEAIEAGENSPTWVKNWHNAAAEAQRKEADDAAEAWLRLTR
jgi:hypothetical protein